MNLVQITPGAGRMYCGNCFRDNALVAELRRQGHSTLMVPLYLPLTLDEPDETLGTPVFFGGVNVYLDQQWAWWRRRAPAWARRLLSSPAVLRWASGRAAKTRAAEVGDLTLSMLRGEQGRQARDLEELIDWLAGQPRPDVVCLSNAMLLGFARRIRERLGVPVVCMVQGEDGFLDALPGPAREQAWTILAERARDTDRLVAPSRYFSELMSHRLNVPAEQMRVVPNGISLAGYPAPAAPSGPTTDPPAIGYFARMCADKGLDLLVEAFLRLRRRNRAGRVRLRVGGGCGPSDAPYVAALRERLERAGLGPDVDWVPNPDREAKLAFLQSLTAFSVPARCGEAFGLYAVEALAAGIPVVQPRAGAFPELVERTGGGVLHEPEHPESLADALEGLLLDLERRRRLAAAGHQAAHRHYSARTMADNMLAVFAELVPGSTVREDPASTPAAGPEPAKPH